MSSWVKAIAAMLWIGLGAWGIPKLGYEGAGALTPIVFVLWIGTLIYGLAPRPHRTGEEPTDHPAGEGEDG